MKTLDAKNNSLGRVASEAAKMLMGKDSASYQANVVVDEKVQIINASKIKLEPKKLKQKVYQKYSGYPGGLKEQTMEVMIAKKGYGEIFKKAVYGMLPANRLRKLRMKNLEIID